MFKNVSKEEIQIPAQMSYLREVRDFIEFIGKKYKFPDKIINSFKLVVDEACTNIIRHGYRDIKDGKITIRAIIRRRSLTMVIIDQGISFDPRQVKNPDLQKYVQIGKKGGLGIFMMRKLMDDIRYNVTSRGNELRLTKVRDEVEKTRLLDIWDSLTLRTKFSLVGSVGLTIIIIIAFFVFNARLNTDIYELTFSQASSMVQNLAEISYEPLTVALEGGTDIPLFQNAKSVKESKPEMIRMAVITDRDSQVVAVYPIQVEMIRQKVDWKHAQLVTRMENVEVYRRAVGDSAIFYFVAPIALAGLEDEPAGYYQLWVEEAYILKQIAIARRNLILYLLLFLVAGYIGLFLLISLITEPFHKLAEWVRQVGEGTVDEDEIDIDASDELGEIAQAFNEMTSKFREAQINLVEQQRLQKELQVAQEIQQMLLPDDFPEVIGYDIASYYQAAKEVGGDLFDFVEVDDQSIGICVADVSGKGVPGSLVMTMIRTALRLEARGNKNPADVLTRVNAFVTEDIKKGMFVTMFYVILDSRERMVYFASAGHNPMILFRGKTKETYYLNPSGFPVGITLPDINLFAEKIQADRIRLHPDDILVLYTDGITEAMNAKRELFGEERFLAAIRKYGHLDVVDFVKSIKNEILNFTGGYEQNDDITLVAIKENMEAVDIKVNLFKELFERKKGTNGKTLVEACRELGISPSTYYRYKKIYEKGGYTYLREMLHGYTNLGLKHLSIEIKTKIYDIIRQHPEFGPKKISDMLNTEKYGYTKVPPKLIYEELKRAKLNTKQQRIQFVKRGGKQRLKPPGTPLLTLDGEVMVGFRSEDMFETTYHYIPSAGAGKRSKEKIISVSGKRLITAEQISEEEERRKAQLTEENAQDEEKPVETPVTDSDGNEPERDKIDEEVIGNDVVADDNVEQQDKEENR
ncbi:MAG: SpoIIE family protein phosphatase [Calditrichaeota bacterium]|nr:SpoIIE family protein phosphatase [Calditrichota bacterium]